MLTKLTLSVEKTVVEKAKSYAKMHNTSISQIVEKYLDQVVAKEQLQISNLGPITKTLMGIATGIPSNKSYKELISNARSDKYMEINK